MGVRVKNFNTNTSPLAADSNREYKDNTQTQRETTVDGYTFHWGPNEVRNFLDQGVGAAHGAYAPGNNRVVEDAIPFARSRF